MSRKSPEALLQSEHINESMWTLAIPMMVSGFVVAFYNTVDSIFVGRYVGNLALAALAVNNVIQITMIAMSGLFTVGVSSIIARALGAKRKEKAVQALMTGLFFGFVVMFVFAWTILFNLDSVLLWIGSPPEVLNYSRQYAGVILWFAFIGPVNDILNSSLRASGRSQWVMGLMLTGAITNIVLDALFIIVFGWGVAGAAVATVLSQIVVCLSAFHIVKKSYSLSFPRDFKKIRFSLIGEIAYVGFPAAIKSGVFALMNLTANRALAPFGADAIAGFGVIYKVIHLAYQPIFGFNLGVQPLIGYSYGAGLYAKVRKIIRVGNINAFLLGLLPSFLLMLAPVPFYRLFTTSDVIITHVRACSFMMGITFSLYGFQMVSTGASLAMGHTWSSLMMACGRPVIMVAIMSVFPRFFGVYGVWVAFPLTDILSSLFISYMLKREFRKLTKKEENYIVLEDIHAE
ncbi:MAG: MATE family efflux transporter [Brevinema sp.]